MSISNKLQNYLISVLEQKNLQKQDSDSVNLQEYKKYYVKESNGADAKSDTVGENQRKKSQSFSKIVLGDTDWKLPAAAYAGGAVASGLGDLFLKQLGGKVAGKLSSSFGEKALKGLKLGGIDIGRQLVGQLSGLAGVDWVNQNIKNIAAGTQKAYASGIGAMPSTGLVVPGQKSYDKIEPDPSDDDVKYKDLQTKVRREKLRRTATSLGIPIP